MSVLKTSVEYGDNETLTVLWLDNVAYTPIGDNVPADFKVHQVDGQSCVTVRDFIAMSREFMPIEKVKELVGLKNTHLRQQLTRQDIVAGDLLHCKDWVVNHIDLELVSAGTCGKPFDDRLSFIMDYSYCGLNWSTFLCECQLPYKVRIFEGLVSYGANGTWCVNPKALYERYFADQFDTPKDFYREIRAYMTETARNTLVVTESDARHLLTFWQTLYDTNCYVRDTVRYVPWIQLYEKHFADTNRATFCIKLNEMGCELRDMDESFATEKCYPLDSKVISEADAARLFAPRTREFENMTSYSIGNKWYVSVYKLWKTHFAGTYHVVADFYRELDKMCKRVTLDGNLHKLRNGLKFVLEDDARRAIETLKGPVPFDTRYFRGMESYNIDGAWWVALVDVYHNRFRAAYTSPQWFYTKMPCARRTLTREERHRMPRGRRRTTYVVTEDVAAELLERSTKRKRPRDQVPPRKRSSRAGQVVELDMNATGFARSYLALATIVGETSDAVTVVPLGRDTELTVPKDAIYPVRGPTMRGYAKGDMVELWDMNQGGWCPAQITCVEDDGSYVVCYNCTPDDTMVLATVSPHFVRDLTENRVV